MRISMKFCEWAFSIPICSVFYSGIIFPVGASIINIASSRAFLSQKDTESYSVAKGAMSSPDACVCHEPGGIRSTGEQH